MNPPYTANTTNENQCICGNVTLNHYCTEEELNQECEEFSPRNIKIKRLFLRRLVSDSFCMDMYDSFLRNKDKKISYIFDLNYTKIRNISIAILVLTLSFIVLVILALIGKEIGLILAFVLFLLIWLARIVLSILLFYYVENGDIEKYDDFLDCKNKIF